MENQLRNKLMKGGKPIGTFFESGSASIVECLALAGLDYFIVDSEHGPFEVESTIDFVMAALIRGITPLARVKDGSRASILKMLDIGVQGLIIPDLHTVEEARQVVEYGKYYPLGCRGVAFGRDAGWGYASHATGSMDDYFTICNRETMLIPQCETRGFLDHIEEISAMEGIDGIFVGPYDLSVALDKPAQFDAPEFQSALDRVLAACRAAGKPCFIYAPNSAAAQAHLDRGFNSVAVGMDTIMCVEGFRQLLGELRTE